MLEYPCSVYVQASAAAALDAMGTFYFFVCDLASYPIRRISNFSFSLALYATIMSSIIAAILGGILLASDFKVAPIALIAARNFLLAIPDLAIVAISFR